MAKRKRAGGEGDAEGRFELVDEKEVQAVISKLVDFAEKRKFKAKVVMVAMEEIVSKLKTYFKVESVITTEISDKVH